MWFSLYFKIILENIVVIVADLSIGKILEDPQWPEVTFYLIEAEYTNFIRTEVLLYLFKINIF